MGEKTETAFRREASKASCLHCRFEAGFRMILQAGGWRAGQISAKPPIANQMRCHPERPSKPPRRARGSRRICGCFFGMRNQLACKMISSSRRLHRQLGRSNPPLQPHWDRSPATMTPIRTSCGSSPRSYRAAKATQASTRQHATARGACGRVVSLKNSKRIPYAT
jgi:hypothetical protein